MDSILLDDSRMQSFIADGYAVVKTDLPADFHQSIYGQIEEVLAGEGNPGNNLLPRIPDLQQVFDQPEVAGALTSILGPGYYLHPHRFCHFNKPGSEGQGLHKDSWSRRHHRLRWAMAFYYPQDTPAERGPTGIVPGKPLPQPTSTKGMRSDKSRSRERPERSPLSTTICGIGPRPIAPSRLAIWSKFLFVRLEEPDGPSWDASGEPWAGNGHAEAPMWHSMWEWYGGQSEGLAVDGEQSALLQALMGDSEVASQAAAYALGRAGEPAVGPLMDCLRQGSEHVRRNAGYGLAAAGPAAVEALAQACADDDPTVRLAAVDSLGDMGSGGCRSGAGIAAGVGRCVGRGARPRRRSLGCYGCIALSGAGRTGRSFGRRRRMGAAQCRLGLGATGPGCRARAASAGGRPRRSQPLRQRQSGQNLGAHWDARRDGDIVRLFVRHPLVPHHPPRYAVLIVGGGLKPPPT